MKIRLVRFLSLIILVSFSCQNKIKKSSYSISGNINKNYVGYIYLSINNLVDSVQVKNSTFHFNGEVSEPIDASLSLVSPYSKEKSTAAEFMLENSNIHIFLNYYEMDFRGENMKIISKDSIKGSKSHKLKVNFFSKMKNDLFYKEKNDSIKEIILYNNLKDFIETNPRSMLSGQFLARVPNNHGYLNSSQMEYLFNKVDTSFQNKNDLRYIVNIIKRRRLLDIGKTPPKIVLPNQEGVLIDSELLKGEFILYEFWASWCAPCRETNPELIKVYDTFKNDGFEILGISQDVNLTKWKTAIKKDKIEWIQVIDSLNIAGSNYKLTTIPYNVLIDNHGKIIARNLKPQKLREILAKRIKTGEL